MKITCIHGFLGAPEDWQPLLANLAVEQAVTPYLAGHNPDQALPDTAAFQFEHQVQRVPPSDILLGYSMGARLALAAAITQQRPPRGLVLISGTAGLQTPTERQARVAEDTKLADMARTHGTAAFLEVWRQRPVVASLQQADPTVWQAIQARRSQLDSEAIARTLEHAGTGVMPDLWPMLTTLEMPVLLLTGAQDEKFTDLAQAMQARVPHATHVEIPGAGHAPHLEAPATTVAILTDWLQAT